VPPGLPAARMRALWITYTTMSDTRNDTEFAVLHRLRLSGFETVTDERGYESLVADGYVVVERDRARLTPAGRDVHARWAAVAEGSEAAAAAETAYTRFQSANERLLKVCHDWQIMRGGIPNDHSDPAYDDRIVGRLRGVHSSATRILDDLVPAIPRFADYRPRFETALTKLDAGGRQWFASPACDSYHTVWMQLHEDLLLATGRSRADEPLH
jgi:hypothetical protein